MVMYWYCSAVGRHQGQGEIDHEGHQHFSSISYEYSYAYMPSSFCATGIRYISYRKTVLDSYTN